MSYPKNLKTLNEEVEEVLKSNAELKTLMENQSAQINEMKSLFQSFIGNHNVTEEPPKIVTEHVGLTYVNNTRKRDVKINFKKIIKPEKQKVHVRDRFPHFLRHTKAYRRADGEPANEEDKELLVKEDIKLMNMVGHAVCLALRKKKWITSTLVTKCVGHKFQRLKNKIRHKTRNWFTKNNIYIDRCVNQWAAMSLSANHWTENYNPTISAEDTERERSKTEESSE